MLYVSQIQQTGPKVYKTPLQEEVYKALEQLQIPFLRVDTDEAITMEDCAMIDARLDMKTVKTLFLCNRQQTSFYLFVTRGDKPFRSKDFSRAMGISRVSFGTPDRMEEMLGTRVGAATIFSALADKEGRVKIVLDQDILKEEWYGCSDGTTTGYMKVKTELILNRFLPFAGHTPAVIEV